jgi:hypothetical protein
MELRYSPEAKVPIVKIDEKHWISFVNEPTMMKNDKFVWLTVHGPVLEVVKKGKKEYGGERQAHKSVYMQRSDIVPMNFEGLDGDLKSLKIYKTLIPSLKKIIAGFLDKNGRFPGAALDSLEEKLGDLAAELEQAKAKRRERVLAKANKEARKKAREEKKKETERLAEEKRQKKLLREEKKSIAAAKKAAREEKRRAKEEKK